LKKKVGTVLDEDLLFRAKKTALVQRKSLSRLLEDALEMYLRKAEEKTKGKRGILSRNTHGAMKISQEALKAIMEEEVFYGS
jgi:hypothetical protein